VFLAYFHCSLWQGISIFKVTGNGNVSERRWALLLYQAETVRVRIINNAEFRVTNPTPYMEVVNCETHLMLTTLTRLNAKIPIQLNIMRSLCLVL